MEKVPRFHGFDGDVSSVGIAKFSLRVVLGYGGSGVGDAVGEFVFCNLVAGITRDVFEVSLAHGRTIYSSPKRGL